MHFLKEYWCYCIIYP